MTDAVSDPRTAAHFRRYRRDAVLLRRPYPPHRGRVTHSKFGGLPNLPAHHPWPVTSKGVPLHFLAQIDCADIGFATPLPDRGMLFFFGRDDEEQIWNYEGSASDDCRVLYVLDAFAATPPRPAPADLPPIGGGHQPYTAWSDYLRNGEPGPNVHVEWPIDPVPIDSWPDADPNSLAEAAGDWRAKLIGYLRPAPEKTWQDREIQLRDYGAELEALRTETFARATGQIYEGEPSYKLKGKAASAIFFHAETGPQAYPQRWIAVHYAARAILHRPTILLGSDPALQAQLFTRADAWLKRSNAAGMDAPVPESDRAEFRAWLEGVRDPAIDGPLSMGTERVIFASLVATIRTYAGDRGRAAHLSDHSYAAMRFYFSGFTSLGTKFSQMLGHAPSAQEPLALDDPTVCLLNFASEDALGWMFGDVGNATFWIAPDDLARRDFTKVWATLAGH
ncbi:DUF1963 domain-containing protein [Sphingopyxis sp.]|uniref:DUF1963 domain-containing protein n=1 Tax=Sphingopyxis sp. TaxID=1908224 RepID=UPI003D12582B